ncbi:hypothetical protein NY08_4218 [Rhodococcus sp. B7740]|nr:hypothetical protein NY08_4218 [Rhodococcus sp. B7740]
MIDATAQADEIVSRGSESLSAGEAFFESVGGAFVPGLMRAVRGPRISFTADWCRD